MPTFIGQKLFTRRSLRRAALIVALPVFGVSLFAYAGCRSLAREIAAASRDPATGVIHGAEARTLLPSPGADGAAQSSATQTVATDRPPAPSPRRACLLLHGFVGSPRDFADLGERLAAQGFAVRLARLPGHGTTPRDFAAQSPDTMYAGALAELRALRAEYDEVSVIGFSMGGALGTLLAANEAVDRLVLIAPYYRVTYQWYYLLPPELWNSMLRWVVPYVIKSERFIKVNRPEAKKQIFSYHSVPTRGVATLVELGKRARRDEVLAAVTCPVLMVISEGDEASSPRAARRAFAAIGSTAKTAHYYTARSNHHLLWDYDGEAAKAEIVEFVAGAIARDSLTGTNTSAMKSEP